MENANLEPQQLDDTVRKFKTVGDIYTRHKGLKKVKDKEQANITLKEELLAYYRSPQGKADIANSPHAHKHVEEIVALLMQHLPEEKPKKKVT